MRGHRERGVERSSDRRTVRMFVPRLRLVLVFVLVFVLGSVMALVLVLVDEGALVKELLEPAVDTSEPLLLLPSSSKIMASRR